MKRNPDIPGSMSGGSMARGIVYPLQARFSRGRCRARVRDRAGCVWRQTGCRQGAFTLLEVILALMLIIVMMSGVFGFYQTLLRAREEGGKVALDAMRARALLSKMTEEIQQVASIVPGDGFGFRGTKDSITIVRLKMPDDYSMDEISLREDLPPAQMDLERITYSLTWDEEYTDNEGVKWCHGLSRTSQQTFDPNPRFVMAEAEIAGESSEDQVDQNQVITYELIAPEIKYIRFKYFDGAEWRDRWQVPYEEDESATDTTETADETGMTGTEGTTGTTSTTGMTGTPSESGTGGYVLPQAVQITIGRERVDPDDEFQLKQEEEEDLGGKKIYHPDRFSIVVYLHQADPSLLSSRMYGVENDPENQMGEE